MDDVCEGPAKLDQSVPLVMLPSRTTSATWGLHNTNPHTPPRSRSSDRCLSDTLFASSLSSLSAALVFSLSSSQMHHLLVESSAVV